MYDWAEFRHFRYLLSILERQGFRVAAEELHTSQPNLSVQARQFQENASVRLYKKLKNGRIRPTETGLAFVTLAKLLLETRDEVIDALIAIERGEIESVRFGCAPLVDQSLFRSFCALHKEVLPACSIRPTHGDTAQLAEEVLTGVVDAAIVTLPLKHPDLRIEEIRRDRLVVYLRRDDALASKPALQATDLQATLPCCITHNAIRTRTSDCLSCLPMRALGLRSIRTLRIRTRCRRWSRKATALR